MAVNRRAEVDKALADVDFSKNVYQVEFDTTMGKILLDTFPDVAPGHAKNLIGLTKIGFYDGIIFHRVISDFVIKVGCPDGNGSGGPGSRIPAEFNKTLGKIDSVKEKSAYQAAVVTTFAAAAK